MKTGSKGEVVWFCMKPLLKPLLGPTAGLSGPGWSFPLWKFVITRARVFRALNTAKFCLAVLTWHPAPNCFLLRERRKGEKIGNGGEKRGGGGGRRESGAEAGARLELPVWAKAASPPDVRLTAHPAETRWSRLLPPAGPGLCVPQLQNPEPLPFRTC